MTSTKKRMIEVLQETELGSSIFADAAAIESAAERLAVVVIEAQAKAVDDIAWQWWVSDMTAEETRARLHVLSTSIKEGKLWEA